MSRLKGRADVGASNDLLGIVSEDKVSEQVALGFGNANPTTALLSTLRRINGIGLTEDRFPPVELQERRNVTLDASSFFDGSNAPRASEDMWLRRKTTQKRQRSQKAAGAPVRSTI